MANFAVGDLVRIVSSDFPYRIGYVGRVYAVNRFSGNVQLDIECSGAMITCYAGTLKLIPFERREQIAKLLYERFCRSSKGGPWPPSEKNRKQWIAHADAVLLLPPLPHTSATDAFDED